MLEKFISDFLLSSRADKHTVVLSYSIGKNAQPLCFADAIGLAGLFAVASYSLAFKQPRSLAFMKATT